MLREIGQWLKMNGEAVYKTRPWTVFGEGPTEVVEGTFAEKNRRDFTAEDIRFTQSKDGRTVYAILLGWPEGTGEVTIRSMAEGRAVQGIRSVSLLGRRGRLKWTRDTASLKVTLPAQAQCDHAVALRIQVAR